MNLQGLFHNKKDFERETYLKRMDDFGFKNMARMELFLWDLELFLQIQRRLGDRVVLKGGAATQFYLPREVQRTSVDIDMLFFGTEQEISDVLNQIEELFKTEDGLFIFHKHIPKNPKTLLPLHTYYVDVPSVLTNAERNVRCEEIAHQELKIEFILYPEKWVFEKRTGENIFAVNSKWEYQLLPLNFLFADKLTTLGCETIGVQNVRIDEQVKQFYDILMLTKYCIAEFSYSEVKKTYLKRAREEWITRTNLEFDMERIIVDVRKQLIRYGMVDNGEDKELKKAINDFNSLYLNRKVEYSPQSVACGAALISLMYECIVTGECWDKVKRVLVVEKKLELDNLCGKEKGLRIRTLRDKLIKEFCSYSLIPSQILKGKSLKRVFWAVVNIDNIDQIETILNDLE